MIKKKYIDNHSQDIICSDCGDKISKFELRQIIIEVTQEYLGEFKYNNIQILKHKCLNCIKEKVNALGK